ncbi:DNA ligase [bacterium]|nr:DNA ligase [bacterium]
MFAINLPTPFLFWVLISLQSLSLNATAYSPKVKPPIQHGIVIKKDIDVSQYWISEKLDGMRGYWNGKQLFSRQGNIINSPSWFTKDWPRTPLDGELWSSRDHFQNIISCTKRKKIKEACWSDIRLMIFDLPQHKGNFTERIRAMRNLMLVNKSPYLTMIKQFRLNSTKQLYSKLDDIVEKNGEGLMLHHQYGYYRSGRTPNLMKLKKYQDDEAVVIKHISGKGKYSNLMGSILVEDKNGLQFKIGSGFTVKEREQPPPIGKRITFKYVGKTQRGVPRFASYLRIREE